MKPIDGASSKSNNVTPWLCGYLLLTTAIGFLVFWLFFAGSDLSTAVRLIFLAVFVLTLKRWTGAVLFAFCQLQLLFLERNSEDLQYSFDGWLWGALSLSLLVLLSRYRTLQDREETPAHRTLYQFYKQQPGKRISTESWLQTGLLIRQLCSQALVLFLCGLLALTVLGMFPTNWSATGLNTVRVYGLKPTGFRLMVITLSLFAGFFAVWQVVNEITWRRISGSQAKIYLNSVLLKFMHRDFRMVNTKRRKLNRKQMTARLQAGDDNEQIEV